ncbi:MAG: MoaD/ThiS family protein [Terriglobales bacterium]
MSVSIHIPTALRPYAGRQDTVEAEGGDVGELLQSLVHSHPQLRPHLFTPEGQLRSFVNVYLNDEDIRYTGSEQTPVKPNDTLSIVPSIAGGCLCSAGRCC